MSSKEIEGLVAGMSEVEVFNPEALDALTLSILQLNEIKFTHLVNTNIHQLGFEQAFTQILMPLLDKLNSMWLSGSIKKVHEEFVGRILKKKIIQEICKLENQESNAHLSINRDIVAAGTRLRQPRSSADCPSAVTSRIPPGPAYS